MEVFPVNLYFFSLNSFLYIKKIKDKESIWYYIENLGYCLWFTSIPKFYLLYFAATKLHFSPCYPLQLHSKINRWLCWLHWFLSLLISSYFFLSLFQMIKFFSRVLTGKESSELSAVVGDMIICSQLLVPKTFLLVVLDLVMQS